MKILYVFFQNLITSIYMSSRTKIIMQKNKHMYVCGVYKNKNYTYIDFWSHLSYIILYYE